MNLEINDTNLEKIQNDFLRIADEILNHHILQISQVKFRILKIEFYFYNHSNHKDENTHALKYKRAQQRQLLKNQWYLHKITINPKCTYKGIDYTFGNGKNYGGILIKEVINIDTKQIFSQSKFIDELISILKPSTKEDFIKIIEQENKLHFKKEKLEIFPIQQSKRKGIVHKSFQNSNYAFSIKLNS